MNSGRYWDKPWSLIDGCTPVSEGCDNCWSRTMAERFHKWPGKVTPRYDRLEIPLKVKKPTVWALWNDLFHEDVPEEFIIAAVDIMRKSPRHTFLVLTKRSERMADFVKRVRFDGYGNGQTWIASHEDAPGYRILGGNGCTGIDNVWLGVTAENQELADKRIPILLQTPAAHRFVSIEPMLELVDFEEVPVGMLGPLRKVNPKVDWVILGGETGPHARPCHPDWVRIVRDQCQAAGVPFWFKSGGETWEPEQRRLIDGREWNEKPTKVDLNNGAGI
jgi:protein gp37